ncbi:MAG: ThiF family adenylyltransferase [Planctomycetota bacterium]
MTEIPSTEAAAGPTSRFARQTRFAALGPKGQERLGEARVLVVGCGALGGVLAQWLARAGVGELVLVDRDVVEDSNLPRQVLFTERHAQEGVPKALASAESLAAIGGPTRVLPHAAHLDADLLLELGAGVDLVLDGTDNMATRYLVNDFAVREGIPWIYGGVVSSGGLVMPVLPDAGPCLRCVFPDPPPAGVLPTCESAGVIGPAVGAIASVQAGLALRILAGGEPVVPALVEIDVWAPSTRQLSVSRAPSCPCCGDRTFEFLEGAPETEAVTLCGRNTVQVLPRASGAPPSLDAIAAQLDRADVECLRSGPFLRFGADDHRFTLFPDGRCLVEGTEDTERALALVARWIGA